MIEILKRLVTTIIEILTSYAGAIIQLLIRLAGLYMSWRFIDVNSESTFQSIIAPILFMGFLMSIAIWLVLYAGFDKKVDIDGNDFDVGNDFDGD